MHNDLRDAKTPQERGILKQRINLLQGKVATIKIGSYNEVDHKEKLDRADDAIKATRCALEEGYVPGGGVTLKDIAHSHRDDKSMAVLCKALIAPLSQILANADLNPKD